MEPYPLKQLNFYLIKKDFESGSAANRQAFKKGLIVQYQSSISNIHGMEEIIHFKDYTSDSVLVWRTDVDDLYDHWHEYLSPIANPLI